MCHLLRFDSLFDTGKGFAFPCDTSGHVDLNKLPPKACVNYLYARAQVGHDLTAPYCVEVPDTLIPAR